MEEEQSEEGGERRERTGERRTEGGETDGGWKERENVMRREREDKGKKKRKIHHQGPTCLGAE